MGDAEPDHGDSGMWTETERLAEEIKWSFYDADGWVLTTDEIAAKIDTETEDVDLVLDRLKEMDQLKEETIDGVRIWRPRL